MGAETRMADVAHQAPGGPGRVNPNLVYKITNIHFHQVVRLNSDALCIKWIYPNRVRVSDFVTHFAPLVRL
jgi:hypothetical protein